MKNILKHAPIAAPTTYSIDLPIDLFVDLCTYASGNGMSYLEALTEMIKKETLLDSRAKTLVRYVGN